MAEMFLEKFQQLVTTHLDDHWSPEDGLTREELDARLTASPLPDGFELPLVLDEFHRALGRCEEILEAHHFFFDADELEIEDGHLIFLEDEEETWVWGVPVEDLDVPDPLIRRRSTADGRWTPEDATVSEFVFDLLDFSFEED
ncbi:MAG: hypothetical protein Q4F53_06675 [Nesterenkonia sp.]|nr:hypothetical protein [Nesterenkonia sp.]